MKNLKRSLFKPRARGEYRVEAKADEATIYLYDEISWFGITAEQFVKDLNGLTAGTIHLRINSPGGSVFDGSAIYNAVKQHKAKIIAHVDGLAASMASVICMAATEVHMGETAFMMIHDPWSLCVGNAEDMRKEADLLDKVAGTLVAAYMGKSKKEETEVLDMMAAETWMNAQEAMDHGFCDQVEASDTGEKKKKKEKEKMSACLFDLSAFANVPEQLKDRKQPPTARDIERVLRDAGCSNKQAKAILAKGYSEDFRDEDAPADPPAVDQRDVDPPAPAKKRDRIADLLIRAECIAPTTL